MVIRRYTFRYSRVNWFIARQFELILDTLALTRILSWNICHGGGTRGPEIVRAVQRHEPDVVILVEFRSSPGTRLVHDFALAGWPHSFSSEAQGRDNGLCVLSRKPLHFLRPDNSPEIRTRWAEVGIPGAAFAFSAVYIPMVDGKRRAESLAHKTRFWDALLSATRDRIDQPHLIIGDFNTGQHRIDEVGATFNCADRFDALAAAGWVDVWRQFRSDAREYTWLSRRRGAAQGNGFRLDHAFATSKLLPRIRDCRYSHSEREAGISDHSILLIDIADPSQSHARLRRDV